jgi:hypothetical protein
MKRLLERSTKFPDPPEAANAEHEKGEGITPSGIFFM